MSRAPDDAAANPYHQTKLSSSTQSRSPPQGKETADDEIEEDDLDSLDIPDLPPSQSSFASVQLPKTVMAPPIRLICTPLPGNFVVADTLYPIASPAPELKGRCQSKYVGSADIDEEHENVEYSKYWNDHRDDPIFAERPSDDSTMSVDDAIALVRQRYVDGEARDRSSKSRSQSRSVSVRRKSVDKYSALTSIEQSIAAEKAKLAAKLAELERKKKLQNGKHASPSQAAAGSLPTDGQAMVKQEQKTPSQTATSRKPLRSDEETEAVLAALGVTGSPKPVDTGPLPPYLGGSPGSLDDNVNSADTSSQPSNHRSNVSTPYPPLRQNSYTGGAGGSPVSTEPGNINAQSYNANGADYTNGHASYVADGQMQSPIESRSEKSGSQKRSFARRDSSSDEEETPARRQEDDVTPKLKRRQPKVAEAYR